MVRLVHTAYQDSKRYTAQVSTWLMQTALHYGYPASSFVRSTRSLDDDDDDEAGGPPPPRTAQQQKNARRKAKQKALKAAAKGAGEEEEDEEGEAPVELQGNFILKSHQYVEVATFLVEEQVSVPTELMLLIRSCIRMRNRCLRPFLADPDASTFTHAHFINVLREVSSIFEQHRNKQQARVSKKEDEIEFSLPTANRFASLEEDLSSTADADEEMPDIQLPAAPRPAKSSVSAAKVRGDLEDTHESAIHMLLLFYADLHSVRDYIRALWADYRTGKTDLLTASVTTNTALELLRKPHQDVIARVLPFFDGDLEAAVNELALLGEDQGVSMAENPDDVNSLLDFLKATTMSPRAESRCDYFFTTHYAILAHLASRMREIGFDLPAPGAYGNYDAEIDFASIDIKTKRGQIWALSMDSWSDWVMLSRAPKSLLEELHDYNFRVLKNSGMKRLRKAPVESNLYKVDEMALEMDALVRTRKPTLLGMFHLEIFNLINFELGSAAVRGLEELRLRVAQMMNSLRMRDLIPLDHRRGDWTDADEELVDSFKLDCGLWAQSETPPTYMRRCYVGDDEAVGVELDSSLMERSPMMCGLLLFRLQLRYQQLSLRMANEWGAIMYSAHTYVACRHSGNSPGKAPLVWPDMDKLLEIHHPSDVFGGKVPENCEESQSAYVRMSGTSARMAMLLKHIGTDAELSDDAKARAIASSDGKRTFKPLRDHTQMQPLFKNRFIGNAAGTCIDIDVIEALLRDIKARQELQQAKKAAAGVSGVARKLLRKERKHKSAKFSIPQLLAVLEAGLRSETESIRFDYIAQHTSCMKILGTVLESADKELSRTTPNYPRNYLDPQSCLAWLLGPVIKDGRRAEREKRPADPSKLSLLVGATNALRQHWEENPRAARAQLAKLGQDGMQEYKDAREQMPRTLRTTFTHQGRR